PQIAGPHVGRVAGRVAEEVLQEERHAAEGAVREVTGRGRPRLLEERDDDRVQRRVERLDAGDGRVHEGGRRRVPPTYELREGSRVESGQIVRHAGDRTTVGGRRTRFGGRRASTPPPVSRIADATARRTAAREVDTIATRRGNRG